MKAPEYRENNRHSEYESAARGSKSEFNNSYSPWNESFKGSEYPGGKGQEYGSCPEIPRVEEGDDDKKSRSFASRAKRSSSLVVRAFTMIVGAGIVVGAYQTSINQSAEASSDAFVSAEAAFDQSASVSSEWSWSDGYESAVLTLVCGSGQTEEFPAEITQTELPASCTEGGTVTYTAGVEVNGETYTDVKSVTIPALGHSFGEASQNVPEDRQLVSTFECTRCGEQFVVRITATEE